MAFMVVFRDFYYGELSMKISKKINDDRRFRLLEDYSEKPHPDAEILDFTGAWRKRFAPNAAYFVGCTYRVPVDFIELDDEDEITGGDQVSFDGKEWTDIDQEFVDNGDPYGCSMKVRDRRNTYGTAYRYRRPVKNFGEQIRPQET